MIPRASITYWSGETPWPSELQIEQDLILSRLIVEIANSSVLSGELAFRGGTCLHKLHLPAPLRYSEDLDYVRQADTPAGPIIDELRELTTRVGLAERSRKQAQTMITYVCTARSESGGPIRIKIETNVAETEPFLPRVDLPYAVKSPWFSGSASVSTFHLNEMMSTKLRALYQRSKGRDLFDLWHVLAECPVDDRLIVDGFKHYMKEKAFSYPQLAQNLKAKLADPQFANDLQPLLVQAPTAYVLEAAANIVMERLGSKLRNAPPLQQIAGGAWRSAPTFI